MTHDMIPEFAIVGHPNEGKSAVVSTLSEDDSVRVTPYPGETITCQTFPVMIDGKEIIRFIDTPGFQNPKRTLAWINNYGGADNHIILPTWKPMPGTLISKMMVNSSRRFLKAPGLSMWWTDQDRSGV